MYMVHEFTVHKNHIEKYRLENRILDKVNRK